MTTPPPVYPPNPAFGQKVGANLCTRPSFPDVSRGAWSNGTVESREMSDYINGPDQPPAPTGIWHNRLGGFQSNTAIVLPGVVIGQSPPPVGGSWAQFTRFRITMKCATSPSGAVNNACGVRPTNYGIIGQDDLGLGGVQPDGVYHWTTFERALYTDVDGSGGGWQTFIGRPVELYLATSSAQLGIHYVRIDWADSQVPDYFDGDTLDGEFESYAWDGAAFLSAASAICIKARDITPPATPAGLVVTGRTTDTIDLDWQTATDNVGVTGYNVYEALPIDPPLGLYGDVKITPTPVSQSYYTVTGIAPGTAHDYYVTAVDAAGNESAHSATVNGITISTDVTRPNAPTGLSCPTKTHNTIDLVWSAATDNVGVTGYNVYFKSGSTYYIQSDMPVTQTHWNGTAANSFPAIGPNQAYVYVVRALDAAGNESFDSGQINVTTPGPPPPDSTPPAAPTTLAVVGQPTHNTVDLDWNAATDNVGVTGYAVYANAAKNHAGLLTQTTYKATGLTPETAYTFTVTAFDAAGNESAESAPATATTGVAPPPPDITPPTAPQECFATEVTARAVTLEWWPSTDNVGVTGYNIYEGNTLITVTPIVTTSAVLGDLTPATDYVFSTTAVDAAGNESGHSPPVAVTTAEDLSPWGIHLALANTLAPHVAAFVGKPGDADSIAAATEYVPIVAEYVRGYTRGNGYTQDEPASPLHAVIVAASARLVSNPEQVTYYQTGDYTERSAVLTGYTLPELGVLRRYRKTSA